MDPDIPRDDTRTRFATQFAFLEQRNRPLATAVADSTFPAAQIENSRSGPATAFVTAGGKRIALHSKYDPVREAEQFVAGKIQPAAPAHAIIGIGLGYHAQAAQRLASSKLLLLFEEDYRLLRAALEHCDLSALLLSARVLWFGSESAAAVRQQLLPLAEILADGLEILVPPVSNRRCPEYVERTRQTLGDVVTYGKMMLTTKRVQGKRTIANVVGNLSRYCTCESLAHWQDRWQRRPALVVAAGPSLVRNRHLIARAKGKMLIIAVGTVLKQLLRLGVQPDVVVHVDHSDLCTRHFQGIEDTGNMVLLADATASPVVLEAWPGRLGMPFNGFAHNLLGESSRPLPKLPQGTTVAHTAYYFAEFAGADPIIFVGQDLAFTDNVYYSPGNGIHELWQPELNRFLTVETKEWERLVRRKEQLRTVPDWNDQTILTDRQMFNYLQQFEGDFSRSNRKIIDATQGGAIKRGTDRRSLAACLDQYAAESFPPDWIVPVPADHRPSSAQWSQAIRACRRRVREFGEAAGQIEAYQRRVLNNFQDDRRVSQWMDQIGRLQQRVQKEHRREFQVAIGLDGSLEIEKSRRTREIENSTQSEREKYRQSIARDADYVAGLKRAASELLKLLGKYESID